MLREVLSEESAAIWTGSAYGIGPGLCRILHLDFREFRLLGSPVNKHSGWCFS
jgi:hypothetical protein